MAGLKQVGSAAYKVAKWIPPIGLVDYIVRGQHVDRNKCRTNGKGEELIILKSGGHLLYTFAAGCALAIWGLGAYETGEINPLRARQVMLQRHEDAQRKNGEIVKKHMQLYERLFGANGLADTNHDGQVDVNEAMEIYRRIGREKDIRFPQLTTDDLEKAVRSFKSDTQ